MRNRVVIGETGEMNDRMKLFVQNETFRKQWLYQVIEGESESERVLRRDPEFILLPDVESDEDFSHLLVLFTGLNLTSLRGEHIPLLRRVQETVLKDT